MEEGDGTCPFPFEAAPLYIQQLATSVCERTDWCSSRTRLVNPAGAPISRAAPSRSLSVALWQGMVPLGVADRGPPSVRANSRSPFALEKQRSIG